MLWFMWLSVAQLTSAIITKSMFASWLLYYKSFAALWQYYDNIKRNTSVSNIRKQIEELVSSEQPTVNLL